MQKTYRVTSAGVNPDADRAHRERMYYLSMGIRVVCVVSFFWVHGWWILIPAIGSIVLPWFAVMIGNAVAYGGGEEVDAPEPLQLTRPASANDGEDEAFASPPVIVIDVDPTRRGGASKAERNGADSPAQSGDVS